MHATAGAVAHRPRPGWTALSYAALFPNYFGQNCFTNYRIDVDIAIFREYRIDIVWESKNCY